MPPRNATQIAFSPELNLYTDKIAVDNTIVKNGATFGQDMFSWGPKIINHETGHAISLPESYNGSGTGATHLWVGGWDLMGNILGHAPEYMAWNKWKLGWLDDPDFGCLASDGSAEYTLSPVSTPSDGVTKKGVVIRTGADDRDRRGAPSPARQRRDRDGHPRRAPHVRLGRAALQDRRHGPELLRLDQGARRASGLDRGGLHRARSTSPRSARARATARRRSRTRRPARASRCSTSRTAISARLKVTRALTRINADTTGNDADLHGRPLQGARGARPTSGRSATARPAPAPPPRTPTPPPAATRSR